MRPEARQVLDAMEACDEIGQYRGDPLDRGALYAHGGRMLVAVARAIGVLPFDCSDAHAVATIIVAVAQFGARLPDPEKRDLLLRLAANRRPAGR